MSELSITPSSTANMSYLMQRLHDSWQEAISLGSKTLDLGIILGEITKQRFYLFLTLFTAILYTMWSSAIVFGTLHTTQSHAYTLTNLHAFIFLVVVLIFKRTISSDEKIIVFLIFVGMALMVFDPWAYRMDTVIEKNGHHYKQSTVMVDFILIISNLLTALFFMFNRMLMRDNSIKYFFLLNVLVMLAVCLISVVIEGARLDTHPKHGLFGWMNAKQAFQNIFLNGFVATLIGQFGPIMCMQFFSPVYCMNVFLAEPVIA